MPGKLYKIAIARMNPVGLKDQGLKVCVIPVLKKSNLTHWKGRKMSPCPVCIRMTLQNLNQSCDKSFKTEMQAVFFMNVFCCFINTVGSFLKKSVLESLGL